MNEKIIQYNGIELCSESFGDPGNPAILLIAGATVSMLFWDQEFCQNLAEAGFFVIRYDNRDVGKSTCFEPGVPPYDIADMTDDAVAILDGYCIKKACFAGISLGGLIAQIAAIKYPERVESLVLMSTGPWADPDPSVPEMDTAIVDFQAEAGTVDWTDENSVVAYLIRGAALMSGRKPFGRERGEMLIRAEFRRARNYLSMFNHARLQGGENYWNRLDEIEQPALIIHGTDDRIWHYKNAGTLLEKLKNSQLIPLEGTGHELHVQDWDTIINEISLKLKG